MFVIYFLWAIIMAMANDFLDPINGWAQLLFPCMILVHVWVLVLRPRIKINLRKEWNTPPFWLLIFWLCSPLTNLAVVLSLGAAAMSAWFVLFMFLDTTALMLIQLKINDYKFC